MQMTQKPVVTMRRANPDDANLLAELGARTFKDTFGADNTKEDMTAYVAAAFNPAQRPLSWSILNRSS
jgi:diamine N-acetyltransferase